jgi:hypothetical protein
MGIIVEGRVTAFILLSLYMFYIFYIIRRTRITQKLPWLRRIPALDAIDEAVGRASETEKPVIYAFGRAERFDQNTLSGLAALSYVAKHTADKGAQLIVPMGGGRQQAGPLTIPLATDIVKTAYISQGKEEDFEGLVEMRYINPHSFPTAAGTVDILQGLRPAAHIFIGQYGGEAIILAEATAATKTFGIGGMSGVGGNLACFAVCLDYVIIGEEVPAIGAYISEDPTMRGSIYAQDMLKVVSLAILIIGIIAVSFGSDIIKSLLSM